MSDAPIDPEQGWYWDLRRGRAVPAAERGLPANLLGPYPSKEAAENWRSTNETRNEAWEADDERWDAWDEPDDGSAS